jgi:hypothetical protein
LHMRDGKNPPTTLTKFSLHTNTRNRTWAAFQYTNKHHPTTLESGNKHCSGT